MVALIVLLVRTQSQEVFLSQSVAGRSLHEYFDQRFLGVVPQNQLCRAVLILPDRRVAQSTEADLASLTRVWPRLFSSPDGTLTLAKDPHDEPLALMAAVIDESVCVIHVAVASDHEARWALHDHLVRLLIARGVRYLLSEGGGPFGALGFAPEVHHYQRLLGYELCHLVPRTAHPVGAARGRRPVDPLTRRQVGSGSDCVR